MRDFGPVSGPNSGWDEPTAEDLASPPMRHFIDSDVEIPALARNWLESHLERELELPLLPEAAARIVGLCDDDDTDARMLESALERDPSLTACVLKVSNSTMYGSKEPIVSLQHAVSRLGMATLRNIALSASLRTRVFDVPGHSSTVADIWEHCAITSVFAREIARKLRRNVEAAFLCGLVHDVGRPIVLQTTLRMPRVHGSLSQEQIVVAMDLFHARVGERLVGTWGLPEWAAIAVANHHEPERATSHQEEARITRLADLLAHWALVPGSTPSDFPVDDPVVAALNLYPDDLDALLELRDRTLVAAEALQ
jgi:putative nucleotidyltransferase with HDIG domain